MGGGYCSQRVGVIVANGWGLLWPTGGGYYGQQEEVAVVNR